MTKYSIRRSRCFLQLLFTAIIIPPVLISLCFVSSLSQGFSPPRSVITIAPKKWVEVGCSRGPTNDIFMHWTLYAKPNRGGGGGTKKRRRKRKQQQQQQQQQQVPVPVVATDSSSSTSEKELPSTAAAAAAAVGNNNKSVGLVKEEEASSSSVVAPATSVQQQKQQQQTASSSPVQTPVASTTTAVSPAEPDPDRSPVSADATKKSSSDLSLSPPESSSESATKKFSFNREEALALGIVDAEDEDDIPPEFSNLSPSASSKNRGAVDLPGIKESVRKKKKKKMKTTKVVDGANVEDDDEKSKERIRRSDIRSFTKLLEVDPNADTDMSYFEEEEYGTVSALLGEGAKSFLGLPLSILQVGHFIGALGIILMAFIEYPGFPLTNLPSSIRGSLQGGLALIYAINTVLAIFAVFKANERGQPKGLWFAKTFTVGGLAYDQLLQVPTTAEMARVKDKKT